MRSFPIIFDAPNRAGARAPRFVVDLVYETASVHFTSHSDITGVPGVVVYNVLQEPSAVSQNLVPDEGRSEIGKFTFSLVDIDGAVTTALRAHYTGLAGFGPRHKQVKFYVGYQGMAFADFQLFTTQVVQSDDYNAGIYRFRCDDITREQHKEIFKPVATTLRQSISASATSIPVADTSKFFELAHDSGYSDAPNATCGYIKIEDEIIRWNTKTAQNFTGIARGVLNTAARAHDVDATNSNVDDQPKVEEFIYLEGPGPALAFQILTGRGYNSPFPPVPAHWSLLFDAANVRALDFATIGNDLWDVTDPTKSLRLRFEGLKAQDGKRWLEKEVFLLCGCYSPVYSDGAVGLKRMAAVTADASPVTVLTPHKITSISALTHDGDSLHNRFRILWAYDAVQEEFIRSSDMIDADSITKHGDAPLLTFEFRGLHGEAHTTNTLASRLDAIRDRYNEPPERLKVSVFGSLNRLEVGDVVRIQVPEAVLRDYTMDAVATFNRSFEVQRMVYNARTGEINLDLFGSGARPRAQPLTGRATYPLPDAYYTSQGTPLSSVLTITAGATANGTFTLTGNASMNNAAAIYYYSGGDLTISAGTTLNLGQNVQIRCKGFLQINGHLNGVGGGRPGVVDPGTLPAERHDFPGNPGFIGNARGWDGIRFKVDTKAQVITWPVLETFSIHKATATSAQSAWPSLEPKIVGNTLLGIPDDLRGTGGGPGGRVSEYYSATALRKLGGTGGAGGAGLCIICRGLAFGGSGTITLDGAGTTTGTSYATGGSPGGLVYAGPGAPGGPGGWLLLLDDNTAQYPDDILASFSARSGSITIAGGINPLKDNLQATMTRGAPSPAVGFPDPTVVDLQNHDYSTAAYRVQYLPSLIVPGIEGQVVSAPTNVRASMVHGGNHITWLPPPPLTYDVVEVYASLDNDRTNSLLVGEVKGSSIVHQLPLGGLRYYWVRARRNVRGGRPFYSNWTPLSALAGVSSNPATPGETPDTLNNFKATADINGIWFTWALPVIGRMTGAVRLYELNVSTPFESALKIYEGYALSFFLPKFDTIVRYYWMVLARGDQVSPPTPFGPGLPAAAQAPNLALSASISPSSLSAVAPLSPDPRTVTTLPVTVTGHGGTSPYTYAWTTYTSGVGTINITSPTSATTTFTSTNFLNGTVKNRTFRCTVTDVLGAKIYVNLPVKISWPDIR